MDGVLADFDRHYEALTGERACKVKDNVDWGLVRRTPNFYRDLPPMPDLDELWGYTAALRPIIITGVPSSVPEAPENKKAWVRKHLGAHVPVICCASRAKSDYMLPGDILVDDWRKYAHLWEARGGIFIHHTSAARSVGVLQSMLPPLF